MVRKDEAPPEFIPPEEPIPRALPPPPSRSNQQRRGRERGSGRGRRGSTPMFEPFGTRNTPRFEPYTSEGYSGMAIPQPPSLPQAISSSSSYVSGDVTQRMIDEIPPSATTVTRDPRKRPEHLRKRSQDMSATLTSSPSDVQPPTGHVGNNTGVQVPSSARSATQYSTAAANHSGQPISRPPIAFKQPSPPTTPSVGKSPRLTSAQAPIRVPVSGPLPAPLLTVAPSNKKSIINNNTNKMEILTTSPAQPIRAGGDGTLAPPSNQVPLKITQSTAPSSSTRAKTSLPVNTTVAFGARVDNKSKKFGPFRGTILPRNSTQGNRGNVSTPRNAPPNVSINLSKTSPITHTNNATNAKQGNESRNSVPQSSMSEFKYGAAKDVAPNSAAPAMRSSAHFTPERRNAVPSSVRSGASFSRARQTGKSSANQHSQKKSQSLKTPIAPTPQTPLQRMAAAAEAVKKRSAENLPQLGTNNLANSSNQPIITTNMVQMRPPPQRTQVRSAPVLGRNISTDDTARLERDRRLHIRRASHPTGSRAAQRSTQSRLSTPRSLGITPPPRRNANPKFNRMVTTANVGSVASASNQLSESIGLGPNQVEVTSIPNNSGLPQAQLQAQALARTLAVQPGSARVTLDASKSQARPLVSDAVPVAHPTTAVTPPSTVGNLWRPNVSTSISQPALTLPPVNIASSAGSPAGASGIVPKRGRGRPRGSKSRSTGRPRGRPRKNSSSLIPTVTSLGAPSPPPSATAATTASEQQVEPLDSGDARTVDVEKGKALSFLAMRGKKRMLPSEPEQLPVVQKLSTSTSQLNQSFRQIQQQLAPAGHPTQQRHQHQAQPQSPQQLLAQGISSNPFVKRQKVAHVLQSLEGPNVAPKKQSIQMLQLRPRNLAVSISPGALTANYLLARSSGISLVPSKHSSGLSRFVSRGTMTTPDLEEPELRIENLGLLNHANVVHLGRKPTARPLAPAAGIRAQPQSNNIIAPMPIAVRNVVPNLASTAARPIAPNIAVPVGNVIRSAPPTTVVRSNVQNQLPPDPRNVAGQKSPARVRTIAPNSAPPPAVAKKVSLRAGAKEISWVRGQKVNPTVGVNRPAHQSPQKEMSLYKPFNRIMSTVPVKRPVAAHSSRKENKIWKNTGNLAPPVNRAVTKQQPVPSFRSVHGTTKQVKNMMPQTVTSRIVVPAAPNSFGQTNVPISNVSVPSSARTPSLPPARKPIQKAKKNSMLKSALQSLVAQQQKRALIPSKKKIMPPLVSPGPNVSRDAPITPPPRRADLIPGAAVPATSNEAVSTATVEDEIKIMAAASKLTRVTNSEAIREASTSWKGPSTAEVRKAMNRAVVRKESGLSARKSSAPEHKAINTNSEELEKFGCWCDEPVNQVPAHMMDEIITACNGEIAPLDLWRWRLVVHEHICENAGKSKDERRAAMLKSFELQPFSMLVSGTDS